jgi:hypothetical protein
MGVKVGLHRDLPGVSLAFMAGVSPAGQERCWRMYVLRVSGDAPLAEDAKYDGDHRCSPWVRTRQRWRSRRAETPLREFTSRVTATCGG